MPPRKRKYQEYLNPSDDEGQDPVLKLPRTTEWRYKQSNNLIASDGSDNDSVDGAQNQQGIAEDINNEQENPENPLNNFDNDEHSIADSRSDDESDESNTEENRSQVSSSEGTGSGNFGSDQHSIADSRSDDESDESNPEENQNQFSSSEDIGSENCDTDPLRIAGSTSDVEFDQSSEWSNCEGNENLICNDDDTGPQNSDNHQNSSFGSNNTDEDVHDEPQPEEDLGVEVANDYFPASPPALQPPPQNQPGDCAQDQADEGQDLPLPDNPFANLQHLLNSEKFNEVIDSAPRISPGELLLNSLNMIQQYQFNHSQSEGIMRLLNTIFKKNVVPPSRYLLDKAIKSASGAHYHFLCQSCSHYFGELNYEVVKVKVCDICQTENKISDLNNSSFFLIFDVPTQLEVLLSNEKLRSNLKNPRDMVHNDRNCNMKDLYDGSMYQKFASSLLFDRFRHVSFCFSVDGSPLFKTINCSIWPIFMCLLELPPLLRVQNLLLGGLWFSKKHPIQDLFLTPFIEHMNKLSTHGFQIHVANEVWLMKAHCLCCCADPPARAAVQSVHQHNGEFGCNWCLHPGEPAGPGKRIYPSLDYAPELRTSAELLRDGREACQMRGKDSSVKGVTGISALLASVSMDAVDGMVLDFMHHSDHGIGYQIPGSWFGEHGAAVPYYIGNPTNRATMSSLIQSLRLPIEARRPARNTEDFASYQARDHQNFNLLFGVPILLEIETHQFKKYLNHWLLFVQAMHFLLQTEVSREQLNLAHILLSDFVNKLDSVYGTENGKEHMTYNMHITLHAAQNVARWGPYWALNAYCFEAGNKQLKGTIASGKGIASQVCRALSRECAIQILESRCATPDSLKYKADIRQEYVDRCIYVDNDRYLGTQKAFVPSDGEQWLLTLKGINPKDYVEVSKLIHLSCVYTNSAGKALRTDNSVAYLKTNGYVYIRKIIASELENNGFLIVSRIHTSAVRPLPVVPAHLAFLRKIDLIENDVMLLSPEDLGISCARMTLPKGDYVVKMPNIYTTC